MRGTAARELSTLALLVVVIVASSLREPRFLQATNVESILLWIPLLAVVGMGQMLVIVTRGIDVSVGSMVGLSAMVVGMAFRWQPHLPVGVGLLIGLVSGTLLGMFNGGLIAWLRVPPIIATLGTLSGYRGLVFIVSQGMQVDSNSLPDALTDWSAKGPLAIGGVTLPWILFFVIAVGLGSAWLVRKSRFGRDIFAIGSNPEGALLRGVPVRKTLFWVYALCGALCGLAGVLYASRYTFVNPATAGQGFELVVIAAVVIGGTKVSGGSGSVLGVLLGCLLLGSINLALAVLGISGIWQLLVYGLVILVAILVDHGVRASVGGEAA